MTYLKVTDVQAVLSAIKEYDEFGKSKFLAKYGFGEAKEYVLVHAGSHYDSKAIYAAAHSIQFGIDLAYKDFAGGIKQVVKPLKVLGFEIFSKAELNELDTVEKQLRPPETFILLWNPDGWAWSSETRARSQQEIRDTGVFIGEWSLGTRRSGVREGDRFFLMKVGNSPRGIIAAGRALGEAFEVAHWDPIHEKKLTFFADIAWEVLLDEQALLPKAILEKELPDKNWTIPGGGICLSPEIAEGLEQIWTNHLTEVGSKPGAAVSSVGTGFCEVAEIERGYTTATVKRRIHQQKFRRLLLSATERPACFVCDFDEDKLLEAAHIIPDSKGGPSNLANGRLLCLNHHKAHDSGMFRFEGDETVWSDEFRAFGAPVDWSF